MKQVRASNRWLLVILALLLTGCQGFLPAPVNPPPSPTCDELALKEESPENLPFETVSARNSDSVWPGGPGLLVATGPQDLAQIIPYVGEKAVADLKMVDFGTSLVVATFSGWKSSASFAFCVTSIQRENQTVTLHAHLIDQTGAVPAVTASYYHLLSIPKNRIPQGEVSFRLALTLNTYEYTGPAVDQVVFKESQEEIVTSVIRTIR